MNYLWAGMMLAAILYGTFAGTMPEITQAAIDSSKEAVTLCAAMLGILAFWMGLMEVAQESGLIDRLIRGIRPALRWLFPGIPPEHRALTDIAVNFIANMLGLGWAATPAGLKAMEALRELEEERRGSLPEPAFPPDTASDEMCTFLVLNISSLQLLPVNVIAYRSQYGSVDPAAVAGPALLATVASTGAAILFCRWMSRRKKR